MCKTSNTIFLEVVVARGPRWQSCMHSVKGIYLSHAWILCYPECPVVWVSYVFSYFWCTSLLLCVCIPGRGASFPTQAGLLNICCIFSECSIHFPKSSSLKYLLDLPSAIPPQTVLKRQLHFIFEYVKTLQFPRLSPKKTTRQILRLWPVQQSS